MTKRKAEAKELKLYRVRNVKSENIIPHGKITTKSHPNLTIEVWATGPDDAKKKVQTELDPCKTWLPDKATVATLVCPNADSMNHLQRLAEGLQILSNRYIGHIDTRIEYDMVTIGDKKPHGFDTATVARLHRLGWELLEGGKKFRFMHIPF